MVAAAMGGVQGAMESAAGRTAGEAFRPGETVKVSIEGVSYWYMG
jgi:hypothetical protein